MLIQNDPFRELDSFFGTGRRSQPPVNLMPMNAFRRGDSVWVNIDLPGVDAESLDINVERSVLTVSAERTIATQEGDKHYLSERYSGKMGRQVHLGEGLDSDGIEADLSNGVLTIRIPVAEKAKPRKILVGAGGGLAAGAIDVETAQVESAEV